MASQAEFAIVADGRSVCSWINSINLINSMQKALFVVVDIRFNH